MCGAIREADRLERGHGAIAPFTGLDHAAPGVEQRQLDVLGRRRARQQVEPLEHEANRLVAHASQLVAGQGRRVPPVQGVAPPRRPIEAAEDMHEGRLPRARRSDHRDELARGDVESHTAQRVHGVIADVVFLGEFADLDQRHQLVVGFAAAPGAGGTLPANAYMIVATAFSAPARP
jgi:hypothetical protein